MTENYQKTSLSKWTNNIFKNFNKTTSKNGNTNNEENFYFKFEEVDDIFSIGSGISKKHAPKNCASDSLVRRFSSEENLYSPDQKSNSVYQETKSKINFGLKRFKIKLSFLRHLKAKKISSRSMFDGYFNSSNYEKMKHVKANTL